MSKRQKSQIFVLKLNKYLQPLGVVGRGSETQFQVAENVNCSMQQDRG